MINSINEQSAQKRALAVERVRGLKRSFSRWCFACYRIRLESGQQVRFYLNPVQRSIHADKLRQIRSLGKSRQYVLKARQPGVTTYAQADNLHCIWSRRGRDAVTLSHAQDMTGKIFEITRRAIKAFPPSLLPRKGAKDTYEVAFVDRDSHFWTGTAGAKVAGRGGTLTQLHLSEFAFYADPPDVLASFSPSMEKVPESSILIETTPSNFDSEAHQEWRKAKNGQSDFRALFFPWWDCDWERYCLPLMEPDELGKLEEDEEALLKHHGLTLGHIKWRREKILKTYSGSRSKFFREYPEDDESCWLTAGNLFYDAETLRELMLRAPVPLKVERGGTQEIFREFDPKERAIIGADTAEGVGGDASAFVARSFEGWKLLSTFNDNHITPADFADVLNAEGTRYARGGNQPALLIVEKNQHGITVLRRLRDDLNYPLSSIYHREGASDDAYQGTTEKIGWQTTGPVYPIMLDAGTEIFSVAKDRGMDCPSAGTLRNALGVYRDDTGKVSLTGKDLLVSEILCWIGRRAPFGGPGGVARLPFGL